MQNNTKTKQKDNFWQSQSYPLTPYKLITLIVQTRGGTPNSQWVKKWNHKFTKAIFTKAISFLCLSLALYVCKGVRETVYPTDPVQL